MTSRRNRRNGAQLEQLRLSLVARAALERVALQGATEDLQSASDRIARIAILVVTLVRSYWLPAGALAVALLFKRARPALRLAQTGIAIWQMARLLQNARR